MTDLLEQFYQFYQKYKYPEVEELTVGYSGIDPPINHSEDTISHEELGGLLGGDENGHYHLTDEQLEKLKILSLERYPPIIDDEQVIETVAAEEMTPYEIQGINVRRED